ncbi:MAG: hypothetical protein JKY03_03355, partial [Aureispira sp.]|nr:hypothetical protein [Aureispira sp.]
NGVHIFVSYNNEASIGLKAGYIVDNNLQGAIIREITGDYIETSRDSGIVSHTPLADTLNNVFCNYSPVLRIENLEKESNFEVNISPNSVTSALNINFKNREKKMEMVVISVLGQPLESRFYGNIEKCKLELSLNSGFYFLKIVGSNRA